jgi:hypothetical protein
MTLDDDNESLLSNHSAFNNSNVSNFGKFRVGDRFAGGQELGAGSSTYRANEVDS